MPVSSTIAVALLAVPFRSPDAGTATDPARPIDAPVGLWVDGEHYHLVRASGALEQLALDDGEIATRSAAGRLPSAPTIAIQSRGWHHFVAGDGKLHSRRDGDEGEFRVTADLLATSPSSWRRGSLPRAAVSTSSNWIFAPLENGGARLVRCNDEGCEVVWTSIGALRQLSHVDDRGRVLVASIEGTDAQREVAVELWVPSSEGPQSHAIDVPGAVQATGALGVDADGAPVVYLGLEERSRKNSPMLRRFEADEKGVFTATHKSRLENVFGFAPNALAFASKSLFVTECGGILARYDPVTLERAWSTPFRGGGMNRSEMLDLGDELGLLVFGNHEPFLVRTNGEDGPALEGALAKVHKVLGPGRPGEWVVSFRDGALGVLVREPELRAVTIGAAGR